MRWSDYTMTFQDTGLTDKAGKPIHVDDIVEHRLGKFGKSGGTSRYRVTHLHKPYRLTPEHAMDDNAGARLTDRAAHYLVVIDCRHN